MDDTACGIWVPGEPQQYPPCGDSTGAAWQPSATVAVPPVLSGWPAAWQQQGSMFPDALNTHQQTVGYPCCDSSAYTSYGMPETHMVQQQLYAAAAGGNPAAAWSLGVPYPAPMLFMQPAFAVSPPDRPPGRHHSASRRTAGGGTSSPSGHGRSGSDGQLPPLPGSPTAEAAGPAAPEVAPRRIEYDRAPRPVSFRPYSLSDMRARAFDPKTACGYWQLGGLGPDFTQQEAWRTLQAKADRQRSYGLAQSQVNRDRIAAARPAPPPPPRLPTSRERALAFARSVPRPRPAPPHTQQQPGNEAKHTQPHMRRQVPELDSQKQRIAAAIRTELQGGPGATTSSAEPAVISDRARIATAEAIQEADDAADTAPTGADAAQDYECLETEQLRQQLHSLAADVQAPVSARPVQEPAVALLAAAASIASQLQECKLAEAISLDKQADQEEQPAIKESDEEGSATCALGAETVAPPSDALDPEAAAAEELQQESGTVLTQQDNSDHSAKDEAAVEEEAAGSGPTADEEPAEEASLMMELPTDNTHGNDVCG